MLEGYVPIKYRGFNLYAIPGFECSRFYEADTSCGPGTIGDMIIPDRLFGLRMTPACNIHDHGYALARTCESKLNADMAFVLNMHQINEQARSIFLMRWLRRFAINFYFSAVRDFGGGFTKIPKSIRDIRKTVSGGVPH